MLLTDFQQAYLTIENINTRLTNEEQQLRKELIQQLIEHYPSPIKYDQKYHTLLHKHIFTLDDNNHIINLYPFSMSKTNKQVHLEQHPTPFFAMCAIDAIGIHFTCHQNLIIETQCELTKTPIQINVTTDKISTSNNTPHICVLHTDLSDISDWANTCCNQMHFFINEQALQQWVKQYGCSSQTYYQLSLAQAHQIAKKLFYTK